MSHASAAQVFAAAFCTLGLALAAPAAAETYSWALPDWRATWSAPRLADDRGFAVAATADAIYTAGVTGSHTTGAGDLFLLRYDLDGNLVWSATAGGFELDQAQDLFVVDDGIWVAGSGTTDDAEATIFAMLLKFDLAGNLVFSKSFSKGVVDVLQAVAVHDDVVYVAGFTHASRLDRNLWAARLDANGDAVWEKVIGGDGWDEAWDIAVDDQGVVIGGYLTLGLFDTTESLLWLLDHDGNEQVPAVTWGKPQNDEVRAVTLAGSAIYVTGGSQEGRSTDVFVSRRERADGSEVWLRTTGGQVTGGGGYGVAVGEAGKIYVAGGSYDFPAGGDAAILRFSDTGDLEWSQILGYPGFWDWGFDVDARDGKFYVAGVLWKPGAEWYEVLTLAYDEDFPTATLEGVVAQTASGDLAGARSAMSHFWLGDFLRWAQENGGSFAPEVVEPSPTGDVDPGPAPAAPVLPQVDPDDVGEPDPDGQSYVYWEGASGYGKNYGEIWADSERDPAVGEDAGIDAILGLQSDVSSGNYALVRNYTGFRVSLFGGFIRLRYYISHDRLIPQGGYLYVGDVGIAIPPPPV